MTNERTNIDETRMDNVISGNGQNKPVDNTVFEHEAAPEQTFAPEQEAVPE